MYFKPRLEVLSQEALTRIHEASLKILNETGMVFHSTEAVEICKKHGARADGKTVYFSPKMVETALESCPEKFVWQARNKANSVTVGEGCLVQPNAGPVYVHDMERGRRPATLEDFRNIQKICQDSEIVQLVGSTPIDPCDVDPDKKHLHIMYEILKHTDKPLIGYTSEKHQVKQMMEMLEIVLGDKISLRENHYIGVAVNPLSPLAFAPDALETIIEYAEKNQIIFFPPAIMAGVCGPMGLFGTIVLQNTEVLGGLTLTQLINPGTPVVYTAAATASYMKRANYNTGAPELPLIHAAGLKMGRDFYHLPTRSLCGMTEAKTVGCQAGYETMQSLMASMLAGANILVECLGVIDSIMTTSYEKIIIDQELISRVIRITEGIDTSDEVLSQALDVIKEVGPSGNYLTHPDTLENFRSNWLPKVSDWETYDQWKEKGCQDIVSAANKKYKEILANAPDMLIQPELDSVLKNYLERT